MTGVPSLSNSPSGLAYHAGFHSLHSNKSPFDNSSRFIEKFNAFLHFVSLDRVKRKKFYISIIYNRFTQLNFKNALIFAMYIFFPKFPNIFPKLREISPDLVRGALPLKLSLWSRVSCRFSLFTLKQIIALLHLGMLGKVKRKKLYIYPIYNRFTLLNFQNALIFAKYNFILKLP